MKRQCPHCTTHDLVSTLEHVTTKRGRVLRCWQCGSEYAELERTSALRQVWPQKTKVKSLSTRALTALLREFGRVPSSAALLTALAHHRLARELGWPPYMVLRSLKGVGRKTADEIAAYGGIEVKSFRRDDT